MKEAILENSDLLNKRQEKIHIVTTKAEKLKHESNTYFREVKYIKFRECV